ncbi:hypothetical protein BKE38_24710 [Pseudoroseomonas deserti]|uniref:Twin-arginine translocation pathway signal n=1 Tax=Teichococcus deserti TaxID=1817963 RepID=A0A1V2GY14_9PROT|nr:DUF1513 domain-containing protein [Pseudoroseomonas deserti]ONG46952.1 hypothetical protein BKE38_24710 [Pseudoroseomonas deserti]
MRRRDLVLSALLAGMPLTARAESEGLVLGAWRDPAGADHAGGFLPRDGRTPLDLKLAARAHGFAAHPTRAEVVVFGRRPGWEALVADLARGALTHSFAPPEGRHFNGHGLFAPDGRLLYATETRFEDGAGLIGVYDAADGFAHVAEFETGGRDSHDMRLAPDGSALVVANGGILTHPDAPRANLDPAGMDPSLVHLDPRTGRQVHAARFAPGMNRLSIRHLSPIPGGTAVAMQYEGDETARMPLLAVQRGTGELQPLDLPEHLRAACRNYIGSVATDAGGKVVAATSPRGGLAVFWDLGGARALGAVRIDDVCGVAPSGRPGGFILSGGQGALLEVDARRLVPKPLAGPRGAWDNHLLRVG